MKKIIALLLITGLLDCAYSEITNWWGMVSFRQRHEEQKDFTDFTFTGEIGRLRETTTNTKTRIGYQFGFIVDLHDNVKAGLTLRSGVGSVMWQDINRQEGLMPGLQEAYIDWQTPFAQLTVGKIPQHGTAMWDLYTCANMTDWRNFDPTDGIFNDRMSALNGVKVQVPVGLVTLRGIYHADYVGGYKREYAEDTNLDDEHDLDWQVYLIGLNAQYEGFELDADVGLPKRMGNRYRVGKDSVYVDETLWGVTLKKNLPELMNSMLQVGYAFNWRDSIFTSDFLDVVASAEYEGIRVTGRYQHNTQKLEFGIYEGHEATRDAMHLYFNKMIWNLDIQPRMIWFLTEIDGKKRKTNVRIEVTSTIRF